jgi:hypothetical protein
VSPLQRPHAAALLQAPISALRPTVAAHVYQEAPASAPIGARPVIDGTATSTASAAATLSGAKITIPNGEPPA